MSYRDGNLKGESPRMETCPEYDEREGHIA